jgi:hypothetical protein
VRETAADRQVLIAWWRDTDSELAYGIVISLSSPAQEFSYSLNVVLSGRWATSSQEARSTSHRSALMRSSPSFDRAEVAGC